MNKITKNTIELLDYVREKQTKSMYSAVHICNELSLKMKGISQSKAIAIPEIIIWDDKYSDSPNYYTFSFESDELNISHLADNTLWWEAFSFPFSFPFSRNFLESRIAFRYKDDFIIIDYDGYVMDIVLIPKTYITGLSDAKEYSIKEITKEQYSSFRSFINDLKVAAKGLRPIPSQIITYVNDKNIDLILNDVATSLNNCEYTYTDGSISFMFIHRHEDSRCIFTFECKNKDHITAIKMLAEV